METRKLKYQIVKDEIVNSIKNGDFSYEKCLPPERVLCEKFNVSRVTLRKSIDELEADGVLQKLQGKGTFINQDNKMIQGLNRLTGFTEDMKSRGMTADSKVLMLNVISADQTVADMLNLQEGDDVIIFQRLRLSNSVPMGIETTYLDDKVFHPLITEFSGGSFYDFMNRRLNITPYRASQDIEVTKLLKWEASLLGDENLEYALLTHRQTFDKDGNILEYVVSKYRGDKYVFHIELSL